MSEKTKMSDVDLSLIVDASEVLNKIEEARLAWIQLNKKMILPHEFLAILLENYTQDFTGEAQRLAADKCTGCTEPDCLVMLDDTCERGRKMGEKPSPNPEF